MIGPHVIAERLTPPYYRTFLENELPLHLEIMPLATRRRMWLRYDGAPPHFGRAVTEFLNEDYEGRSMGRCEPVALPARSPDLISVDFFPLDCMKSTVCHVCKPETRLQLVFLLVSWGGVRLSPLGTSATNWPIVPAPDDR
jgi:hypothetical protein